MGQATTARRRRARGEGSIYPVAGGGYRGAITVTDPVTGRASRRYASGRSKAEVRERLAAIRKEVEALGPTAAASSLTVGEYLARWLPSTKGRMRPSTWRGNEQYIRLHIAPALGRVPLARLLPSDVERMTAGMLEAGRAPATARSARTVLRTALADAMRDGLIARNAAALARPPRQPHRDITYLTPAEVRRLLEATADDEFGPIYTLAVSTGLRQGELLGLTWDDVDTEAATLRVRRSLARTWDGGRELAEPKSARARRTIPLSTTAVLALRRQRARQAKDRLAAGTAWQDRDGLVFTDAVGRPLSGTVVTHRFTKALAAAGVRHVAFHDLRHTAATLMLAQGIPLATISDLLGHSTVSITATYYAAVTPDLRRDAADAIERALS